MQDIKPCTDLSGVFGNLPLYAYLFVFIGGGVICGIGAWLVLAGRWWTGSFAFLLVAAVEFRRWRANASAAVNGEAHYIATSRRLGASGETGIASITDWKAG